MSADIDAEDLAYVRRPVGYIGRAHYATGRAPAGSDTDRRIAWAVANANQVAEHGSGYWSRDGGEGGAER